jgi:sigma-B regulation protein RsbU (phosphoserine phosphatase)
MHSLFSLSKSGPEPAVEVSPIVFPKIDGAEISAASLGERVAGDFYDSLRVSPERVLFGLLDVAGRREDNRNILAAAQDVFRTLGTDLFSRPDINESDAMVELCLQMNRRLIEVSKGVHSCPAFIGCYHEQFGTLCYTNAGHTPGLLRDGAEVTELGSTGLPLGLFSHATCDAPTIGIEKGAALLLVSRGVIECKRRHHDCDDEYGLDRVKELLRTDKSQGAQALVASILDGVAEFSHGSADHDDKTALAFVRAI